MQRLKQIYSDETAANKYRMLLKYYRYVRTPSDGMSEHIGKMTEMRKALEEVDENQSEELFQVMLIGSLPQEYASMLETWELTTLEMRTTANLVGRLVKREDVKTRASRETILVAKQLELALAAGYCGPSRTQAKQIHPEQINNPKRPGIRLLQHIRYRECRKRLAVESGRT